MNFDWTISLGSVFNLVVFAGTVIWFLANVKVRMENLEGDIHDIKDAMKDLGKNVVSSLVTTGRLATIEERVNLLIRRVDFLYNNKGHHDN